MGGEIFELSSERIIRETTEKVAAQYEQQIADLQAQLAGFQSKSEYTNGVVSVMGGEIFELSSERIIRETTKKVAAQYEQQIADMKKLIADLQAQLAKYQNQ